MVFGENPYAEFQGDLLDMEYSPGDKADLALLKKLGGEGIPVVAVFISGRPLWVNREINASSAFVAAWLPGSEGGGVADVLFSKTDGSVNHDFTGKLSFSWPRTPDQTSVNSGDAVVRIRSLHTGTVLTTRIPASSPHCRKTCRAGLRRASIRGPSLPKARSDAGGDCLCRKALVRASNLAARRGNRQRQSRGPRRGSRCTGGMRAARWTGTAPAIFRTGGRGTDRSATRDQWRTVAGFRLSRYAGSHRRVLLSVECGIANAKGSVPVALGAARVLQAGEWRSLKVLLSCFPERGCEHEESQRSVCRGYRGKLGLSITNVRLGDSAKRTCSPAHGKCAQCRSAR